MAKLNIMSVYKWYETFVVIPDCLTTKFEYQNTPFCKALNMSKFDFKNGLFHDLLALWNLNLNLNFSEQKNKSFAYTIYTPSQSLPCSFVISFKRWDSVSTSYFLTKQK